MFVDREPWPQSGETTYPRSHHELIVCFEGTNGPEVRGDMCHGRDPLGGLPVGFEKSVSHISHLAGAELALARPVSGAKGLHPGLGPGWRGEAASLYNLHTRQQQPGGK